MLILYPQYLEKHWLLLACNPYLKEWKYLQKFQRTGQLYLTQEIYKGYVDDPRNTDNAWMETEAVNYHDETGEIMDSLTLEAGDDAGKVMWVDISGELKLYTSHSQFIKLVAEKRDAHWSEDLEDDC